MLDPDTIGQVVGGTIGAALAAAIAVLHNRFQREAKKRPLYENGQRDEIIRMIRALRQDIVGIEDRVAELKRDSDEGYEVHKRLIRRLEGLESKQRPQTGP